MSSVRIISESGRHGNIPAALPALPRKGDTVEVLCSDGVYRDVTVLGVGFELVDKGNSAGVQVYKVTVVTE